MTRWTMLLTIVACNCATAASRSYSCGPFLLGPGPRQMTIVIDHIEPLAATLTYRRADGVGVERRLRREEAVRHHMFALQELEPDTEYSYHIESGDSHDSGSLVFRTLPEAPKQYRIIAVGDTRTQPDVWHEVSQRIYENEQQALFMIGTGDYPADGSKYQQWIDQFFAPARNLLSRIPFWPSIGNHERTRQAGSPGEPRSHYFSLFELPGNEHWYRVDYQYLTLLVIDSNSQMAPGHEQYEWLTEQLRSERGRFTIAAFHHAPVTSGPHGRRRPDGTPEEWPLDQGQRFLMPLFEMYGVDLVLNGHDHIYERSYRENVYYVVTGGGGAPLYQINSVPNPYQQVAKAVNHYVTLDIDGHSMTLTAIDLEGHMIDWFIIPVSKGSRARNSYFALEKLRSHITFGELDREELTVAAVIGNPLAVDVQVRVGKGDSLDEEAETITVRPGEEVAVSLSVSELVAQQQGAPSWRGRISGPLALAITADDDGLPLATEVVEDLILREASYDAASMPPPTIDGSLSEWEGVEAMLLDNQSRTVHSRELYSGDTDMVATVRLGWSAGGLHLAIDVRDDTLTEVAANSTWLNDGVEVYFDGRAESERVDAYEDLVSQIMFPALRDIGESFEGNRGWPSDAISWALQTDAEGYVIEATIPYRLLRGEDVAARAGDTVRFDLMVNDRDGRVGGQTHHRLWSRSGASSNTSGYGLVVLRP